MTRSWKYAIISAMSTDPNQPQNPASQTTDPVAQSQTVRPFNYSNQDPATPPLDSMAKGTPSMHTTSKVFVPLCIVVIVAGILTGLGLNKLYAKGGNTFQGQTIQ